MSTPDASFHGSDPWMKMWSEMMSNMASAMPSPMPSPPPDPVKQMREAFLGAWAKHCEEFLRSEPFLDIMKQSIDQSLAFRQQVNDFLRKGLREGQMAGRGDAEDILRMLHGVEDRVLDRLDDLTRRMERLEHGAGSPAEAKPARKHPRAGDST